MSDEILIPYRELNDFQKNLFLENAVKVLIKTNEIRQAKINELENTLEVLKETDRNAKKVLMQRDEIKNLKRSRDSYKDMWERELCKNLKNNNNGESS